jgi:hypothetical protein
MSKAASEGNSGNIRKCMEHLGNIQGTFREHSGNIQGTFREHLGKVGYDVGATEEAGGGNILPV